jgi:hypothetical protein
VKVAAEGCASYRQMTHDRSPMDEGTASDRHPTESELGLGLSTLIRAFMENTTKNSKLLPPIARPSKFSPPPPSKVPSST